MGNSENIIKIVYILKSNMADDKNKGDIIFEKIKQSIYNKSPNIKIDFKDVEGLNTAFLNNAIGKVFSIDYNERKDSNIQLINFPSELKDLLEEAINTARDKYSI